MYLSVNPSPPKKSVFWEYSNGEKDTFFGRLFTPHFLWNMEKWDFLSDAKSRLPFGSFYLVFTFFVGSLFNLGGGWVVYDGALKLSLLPDPGSATGPPWIRLWSPGRSTRLSRARVVIRPVRCRSTIKPVLPRRCAFFANKLFQWSNGHFSPPRMRLPQKKSEILDASVEITLYYGRIPPIVDASP